MQRLKPNTGTRNRAVHRSAKCIRGAAPMGHRADNCGRGAGRLLPVRGRFATHERDRNSPSRPVESVTEARSVTGVTAPLKGASGGVASGREWVGERAVHYPFATRSLPTESPSQSADTPYMASRPCPSLTGCEGATSCFRITYTLKCPIDQFSPRSARLRCPERKRPTRSDGKPVPPQSVTQQPPAVTGDRKTGTRGRSKRDGASGRNPWHHLSSA